jgi:ABC-type tungstate transport system permease subunit
VEYKAVSFYLTYCSFYRYVHQGKGMLQRHQLLNEFEALFESDKERYANFEDILRAAKVTLATCLTQVLAS